MWLFYCTIFVLIKASDTIIVFLFHSFTLRICSQRSCENLVNDQVEVGNHDVTNVESQPEGDRPQRIRKPPNMYGEWSNLSVQDVPEPETFTEALKCKDASLWQEAMQNELNSMKDNNVWDQVDLPKNRVALKCKWVFKKKIDSDSKVIKHKTRLVAKGFDQKYEIDYNETFCPVVKFESVRTISALAVKHDLKLHQLDVSTAFLNGELQEEVYMMQPNGFQVKGKENLVCKLNKSIYGLKQEPRC